MVKLGDRIAALAPAKLELLTRRLGERASAGTSNQKIVPRDSEMQSRAPVSFAQERLWFLSQLEPESSAYNIFLAVRMTSALDVAAFSRSLNEIVRRHEILRTTFAEVGGRPVQVIAPAGKLRLPLIDFSNLPIDEGDDAFIDLALAEAQRPFDIARGPLFRVVLLRFNNEHHVVFFTMHHIISDAWSMELLVREVATLYVSFTTGRAVSLPDLPIQYADFANWQRESFQGEVREKQLEYWKRQLHGRLPLLHLPFDRSKTSTPSEQGAREVRVLDQDLTAALKGLCQKEGVTLFMLMVGAFKTLIYWYSGQEDVIVGTPIANRNCVEIEPLIGLFINTLVLRTSFSGNPTFREMLARVRDVTLGAYAHCDLPFERLVQTLEPERTLSRTLLFQVAFNFRSMPKQSLELPNLALSYLPIYNGKSQFEMNMIVIEDGATLKTSVEYKTDLFTGRAIRRMLERFEELLRAAVENHERSLDELKHRLDAWEQINKEKELSEVRAAKFKHARRKAFVRA